MVNEFEKQDSLAKGALGAVLGAAANILVWIVIGSFGVPGSISGWVAALLSIKLYEYFGGKIQKKGVVICAVSCAVFLLAANYLFWSLQISTALNMEVGARSFTIIDGIKRLPAYFGDAEFFITCVVRDIIISFGFCAVGMITTLIPTFKKRKLEASEK